MIGALTFAASPLRCHGTSDETAALWVQKGVQFVISHFDQTVLFPAHP
jgi:hypothetical protein